MEIDADWMRFKAMMRSIDAISATFEMTDVVEAANRRTSMLDCLYAEYDAMSYQTGLPNELA